MFAPWFLAAIVYGGLVLVGAGALTLAGLWLVDLWRKTLW